MQGEYDPLLVALSVLLAVLASYTALDLAGRVGHRRRRIEWVVGGSLAMGTGIWSMHYVGMLALRLPVPVVYDGLLLFVSFLVSVAAAAVAFSLVAARQVLTRPMLAAAAVPMGAAIAAMHYIGKAALTSRTPVPLSYDAGGVALSIVVAYLASLGALWLAFRFRRGADRQWLRKLGAAALMGAAIAGMHYTAMHAAEFGAVTGGIAPAPGLLGTPVLAVLVATGAVFVLALGIVGAAVDRGFQEAIGRTEARFRSLVENVTEVITLMDVNGVTQYVSPSIERMLGYRQEERIGRSPLELVHPDDLPLAKQALAGIAQATQPVQLSVRLRHKDGTWRWIDAVGCNLLTDPAVGGIIITARDVTARHQLEEQLRQSQKMEAVGRLAGGVAHDFNNLLTVIKGHAQFALEDTGDGDPRRLDLVEVLAAAERAAALTSQLLAFSRRQMLKPRLLDVNEVVANAERMLSRIIGEDIRLETDLRPDIGQIRADPGQLEQVLLNLVVNARDAIRGGGTVTIATYEQELDEAAAQEVSEVSAGAYVVLRVSDDGEGMDAAQLAHLFEPFYTTKPAGKGTGLGLSTVYGIVKQSGGGVKVTSAPGRGTSFEIFLPRAAAPAAAVFTELEESEPRRARGRGTILVVEDEPALRSIVVRILRREGYTVLEAGGPAAALTIAEGFDRPIQLLVTDIVMPGMSGVELAQTLQAVRSDLRVLYISGYAADQVLRRGVADATFRFLAKPFLPEEIAAVVNELMETETAAEARG